MAARIILFVTLMTVFGVVVQGSRCPPPCPMCPDIIPCSTPTCPVPKCPPLPDIPPCPVPRCPSLPEIPACPTPVLNLSCPNVTCPPQSCPPCPSCPNSPTCPPCSSTPTASPKPLPPGYERKPGLGVYKFYHDEMSWFAANQTCAEEGAHLVIPDNKLELNMLLEMMGGERFLHVGVISSNSTNEYITSLGQPMTTTQNNLWAHGEPDAIRRTNCVYLSGMFRGMADESCYDTEPFVCEMPA